MIPEIGRDINHYYSIVTRKNIVGIRIRAARQAAKYSQEKLAAEMQLLGIKIDRTAIAKLESGRRPASDIEIIAIAKILNISIPDLFKDSDKLFSRLQTL
ncbi:MAG: helix-turn-helix transcriptional regulator [Chloroflexota bacterium]